MNKEQIWQVLQSCLLSSEGMAENDILKQDFGLAEVLGGIKLHTYLASKELYPQKVKKNE